jgi:hypothetical protein
VSGVTGGIKGAPALPPLAALNGGKLTGTTG